MFLQTNPLIGHIFLAIAKTYALYPNQIRPINIKIDW
jgi:hypothetical protein